jgi:hypothetical protein
LGPWVQLDAWLCPLAVIVMTQNQSSQATAAGTSHRKAVTRPAVSLAAFLLAVLSACDDRPPTAPGSTPTTASPMFVRLEIVGPRSVPPGETVQLRLTGHLSDGSTIDLTSQAGWQSQHRDVLSIDSTGRATAHRLGESVITGRAGQMTSLAEIVVVPAGTFRLSVIAREAGVLALDVRVEVLSGRGAGLFDVTPDNGRYDIYGVEGDTLIRISGSGYIDDIRRLTVTEHMVVNVDLVPTRPGPPSGGTHTLTIAAAPECRDALPEDLRTRKYVAVVGQLGPEITVTLHGADFQYSRSSTRNRFSGQMDGAGSKALFSLGLHDGFYYPEPEVVESLGGSRFLMFVGRADTLVSQNAFAGVLDGSIELWEVTFYTSRQLAACRSSQHLFVLSR